MTSIVAVDSFSGGRRRGAAATLTDSFFATALTLVFSSFGNDVFTELSLAACRGFRRHGRQWPVLFRGGRDGLQLDPHGVVAVAFDGERAHVGLITLAFDAQAVLAYGKPQWIVERRQLDRLAVDPRR